MPIEAIPLILFSGLAADASVFAPQKIAFPQLTVPRWPVPAPNESMDSYCQRLADELRVPGPCVIGGASFGGMVAQEISRYLDPLAIILIGSVRSPAELPGYARWSRSLRFLVPWLPIRLLQAMMAPAASNLARRTSPHLCGLARQFRACDPRVFRWSLRRILDWRETPEVACPIYHVHGDRDFVLPSRLTKPDRIVAGGGHVISLTHPTEVNQYIRQTLDHVANEVNKAQHERMA